MSPQFEQGLVESAVALHLASGRAPALQAARFHREREKLYRIAEPDERDEAFFKLHLEWFREWQLDEVLVECARERPLLEHHLALLAFRSARIAKEEGAEMYVNEAGQKHGIVALRSERFRASQRLRTWLRHELLHLSDMVDPVFAYEPNISGPATPAQQRLARERYRVLWDVTIDGRLDENATKEQRRAECHGAFAFWPEEKRESVFSELWNHAQPTHRLLEGFVRDPRDLQQATGPTAGGPCPLCGFPTFDWAKSESLAAGTIGAISLEFPRWSAADGVCARCADIYRLVSLERQRQYPVESLA